MIDSTNMMSQPLLMTKRTAGLPPLWFWPMAFHVLYILQTSMHAWHFEYIVSLQPIIKSLIAHTKRLFNKCDIGASECTFVHGIGIVVLNKLTKCVIKTLLATTPLSHQSHTTSLVTVHGFIFRFSVPSFI